MAGNQNANVKRIMRLLRKALRKKIPPRYSLRLRAIPVRKDMDLWDIVVISDYFRGKGFSKRLEFLQKVEDGLLTPEERFKYSTLPFSEREARKIGL